MHFPECLGEQCLAIQYFTFKCFVKVNNAAAARFDSFLDETLEQFDLIMATNIRAVYQLTQLAVPHLIESKGSIVNVSSTVVTTPVSSTHICYELLTCILKILKVFLIYKNE